MAESEKEEQLDRRLWVAAWWFLVPYLYLVLNGGGYFLAVSRVLGMVDLTNTNLYFCEYHFERLVAFNLRAILVSMWGVLAWPGLLAVPYGLWKCIPPLRWARRVVAGLVVCGFVVILFRTQASFFAPFEYMERCKEGMTPLNRQVLHCVRVQSWKPHASFPKTRTDVPLVFQVE